MNDNERLIEHWFSYLIACFLMEASINDRHLYYAGANLYVLVSNNVITQYGSLVTKTLVNSMKWLLFQ